MKYLRILSIIILLTVLSLCLSAHTVSGDTLEAGGEGDFHLKPGDKHEKDVDELKSGYTIKYSWYTSKDEGRIDLVITEQASGKIFHEVKGVKSEENEIKIETGDTYLFNFSSNYENYTIRVNFQYSVYSPSSDDSPGFGLLGTLLITGSFVACVGWKRRRNERI